MQPHIAHPPPAKLQGSGSLVNVTLLPSSITSITVSPKHYQNQTSVSFNVCGVPCSLRYGPNKPLCLCCPRELKFKLELRESSAHVRGYIHVFINVEVKDQPRLLLRNDPHWFCLFDAFVLRQCFFLTWS